MPSFDTTSATLTTVGALVQNLGPDELYVADVTPATSSNGFRLESGESLALGSGRTYYAVSVGTSDVRVLGGSSGVFDDVAAP